MRTHATALLLTGTTLLVAACGGSGAVGSGTVFEVPDSGNPGVYVVAASQPVANYFQQQQIGEVVDSLPSGATQASCATSDYTVYIDADYNPSLDDINLACNLATQPAQ